MFHIERKRYYLLPFFTLTPPTVCQWFRKRIDRCLFGLFSLSMAVLLGSASVAWAHSSQFHGGGMGGAQFHRGQIGGGHFHHDQFHHHHGALLNAPPLVSYYQSPTYYPPTVVIQGGPMTFIEQGADGTVYSYWSYCANPPGFYPQVQQCFSGWQTVPAKSTY